MNTNKGGTRPHHNIKSNEKYIRVCGRTEISEEKEELISNINFKLSPIDDT